MLLTLLKSLGTARSLLQLFIYVVVLFGIPLALLALRMFEILSERRREEARLKEEESMSDAESAGRAISTCEMKNA